MSENNSVGQAISQNKGKNIKKVQGVGAHPKDVSLPFRNSLPEIRFPEELPVSQVHAEIAAALKQHQVIIVVGETGSGKTTQLPKIALSIGRGRTGLIGHTQPRRLAASSVAQRIAQELGSELGQLVGYQVRFQEKIQTGAWIKLMTDGVLLAEIQKDPLLKKYDTLIIDEAHERSLNIDFLLGYLKQILERRPDLKIIITSATIHAEKFSQHFKSKTGDLAPLISVEGRSYPVEILYQPLLETTEEFANKNDRPDMYQGIAHAVDTCTQKGSGDILVFLPGEKEIKEAEEVLSGKGYRYTEIIPLYARLSHADQQRIFKPQSNNRRIILATNVAETSLTVPGIRFVIDTGIARVKRYSWRNKVEQLHIEPISQASAKQRAGRCGRVGPGVCIRLYEEQEFLLRPEFTDPEILRSSLASVILKMKDLRLNEIQEFPFIEAPSGRAIADGYQLLHELGALTEENQLTSIGKQLARLPFDPKVARMILAARQTQALAEVMVIASALSLQDVRERPAEQAQAADQAQQIFQDPQSGFMSYLKLWDWYQGLLKEGLSYRKRMETLRKHFISVNRFREWVDTHQQLHAIIQEQGWKVNETPANYQSIHLALMAGLVGNILCKAEEKEGYLGLRGIHCLLHPSIKQAKKAGKWLLAAELVDTSRLYARCIAKIEPQWIESVAGHLFHKNYSDPRWDVDRGSVYANERATLFGLPIYHGRKVLYHPINLAGAREIFIRSALVEENYVTKLAFYSHNQQLRKKIERLEHQSRRPDILVQDDTIFAFYDEQIPADIYNQKSFEHWMAQQENPKQLFLEKESLMQHDAAQITADLFPKAIRYHGVDFQLSYHFEPGSSKDGVTLKVPVHLLNQLNQDVLDWLVPGMLKEKVGVLLKSLPQKLRRHCVPLPQYSKDFFDRWYDTLLDPKMSLVDALIKDIQNELRLQVLPTDFKLEQLPEHMKMNFAVQDEHGHIIDMNRNLASLKSQYAKKAQQNFQQVLARSHDVALNTEDLVTEWSFGPLPEIMEIQRKGKIAAIGYPALVDEGNACRIDVFEDALQAQTVHTQGLLKLFRLQLKDQIKYLEKNIPNLTDMGLLYVSYGSQEALKEGIINLAIRLSCMQEPWPNDATSFEKRIVEGKTKVGLLVQEIARTVLTILKDAAFTLKRMATIKAFPEMHRDLQTQMQALVFKGFFEQVSYPQLQHYSRYFKAIDARIERVRKNPAKDEESMKAVQKFWGLYQRRQQQQKGQFDRGLEEFRWAIEELRVALFAQELRTPHPVSVKRLEKIWQSLGY